VIADLTERARSAADAAQRATPVPLGVRCGVFLAGLVAIVLAYPPEILFSRFGSLLLVVPLLPAAFPRGRTPTLVVVLAILGWLYATTVADTSIALWRLLTLAWAMYLLHNLAALAAALPYDAVVPLEVVARWVGRTLGVLLGAAVLGILALSAAGSTGDQPVLAASLLGFAVAVAVAALLAWLWRRR
jgi:hypothetical protein